MGLKSSIICWNCAFTSSEEIRPRWDWNTSWRPTATFPTRKKSDQGGIEIEFPPADSQLFEAGRNQTKVGLKCSASAASDTPSPRRNQTKVGLKLRASPSFSDCTWEKKSDQGGIEISSSARFWARDLTEEIRPRWDWNTGRWLTPSRAITEEIRPRWDWNERKLLENRRLAAEEIRPRWDWNFKVNYYANMLPWRNQTKVGLKFLKLDFYQLVERGKKSDQGGIEIAKSCSSSANVNEKKSDQGGIEMGQSFTKHKWELLREEIRPRWDWNCTARRVASVMLKKKSDQGGIEIMKRPTVPICTARRNQTKVGLKWVRAQGGGSQAGEEIRPRWDWNTSSRSLRRTSHPEEIRPRWDWNRAPYAPRLALFRRNQRRNQTKVGLKCIQRKGSIEAVLEKKSDQGGIEIPIRIISHLLQTWRNQTKVGLKCAWGSCLWSPHREEKKSDQGGIEIWKTH